MQSLADKLNPLLLDNVRSDIQPKFEEQHQVMQTMLQRQDEQIVQAVVGKLQLTLQTVHAMYEWMNQTSGEQMPLITTTTIPEQVAQTLVQVNGVNGTAPGPTGTGTSHAGTLAPAVNGRAAVHGLPKSGPS